MSAAAPEVSDRESKLVLWIAMLASFVAFLDASVINVALPAIARSLGGGLGTQQWVVDAYLITLGSLMLLAGSLSDALGRTLILRVGLVTFGVTSLLCAASPNPAWLVVSRGLQGIAGALLVPSSLALITSTFNGPARAKAIGQWTAGTTISFIAGPLLGGVLVDYLNWRYVFAINVVPIAITLVLLTMLRRRGPEGQGMTIDYLGAILCVFGLGGPVYALIEHDAFGWRSPGILGPLLAGAACFAAFLWRQQTAAQPLMPLRLFAVRNFGIGNTATAFVYGALSIGGFVTTLYLQQVAGYSATVAALALLPISVVSIFLSSWLGALSGKYGPRWFMGFGPMVAGTGYLVMLSAGADVRYWTQLFPGIALFGLGLAATVAPLTSAILGSISERQSGIGSAINNAISRVAGLVAIAFLGVVIGTKLDVAGFHRALVTTAALLFAGGAVSAIGIRNKAPQAAERSR